MVYDMANFQGDIKDTVAGRYAIVASRYNGSITSKLLDGALRTLHKAGVAESAIDVAHVPGAFEIPLAADQMASSGHYVAVLCLGAVIRGETTHDEHINRAVSLGIMEANLRHGVPVLFGVLTCNSFEQAIQRAGEHVSNSVNEEGKASVGNKGVECARAALEMVSLLRKLKSDK